MWSDEQGEETIEKFRGDITQKDAEIEELKQTNKTLQHQMAILEGAK